MQAIGEITTALEQHVDKVQQFVTSTDPRYEALYRPGELTHPLAFFGNPETAVVATVGLNPSSLEFAPERGWPQTIDAAALTDRCLHYFEANAPARPHPWFETWSKGLKQIGAGYESGSAIHLDISPRPTRSMRAVKIVWPLLLEMLRGDLWTLFSTLELSPRVKLVILAGTATGEYYLNEFLQEFASESGYRFEGTFKRSAGVAKVSWHQLVGKRSIPVFFCSHSPASPSCLLPQRMRQNASRLKQILASPAG